MSNLHTLILKKSCEKFCNIIRATESSAHSLEKYQAHKEMPVKYLINEWISSNLDHWRGFREEFGFAYALKSRNSTILDYDFYKN